MISLPYTEMMNHFLKFRWKTFILLTWKLINWYQQPNVISQKYFSVWLNLNSHNIIVFMLLKNVPRTKKAPLFCDKSKWHWFFATFRLFFCFCSQDPYLCFVKYFKIWFLYFIFNPLFLLYFLFLLLYLLNLHWLDRLCKSEVVLNLFIFVR